MLDNLVEFRVMEIVLDMFLGQENVMLSVQSWDYKVLAFFIFLPKKCLND